MIACVLSVADVDTSFEFYTDTLGLTPGGKLSGSDGRTRFANVYQNDTYQIMLNQDDQPIHPENQDRHTFRFELHITLGDEDDIHGLYERAKAHNATILEGMRDQFWGERTFVLADPDGYRVRFAKAVTDISLDEWAAIAAQEDRKH